MVDSLFAYSSFGSVSIIEHPTSADWLALHGRPAEKKPLMQNLSPAYFCAPEKRPFFKSAVIADLLIELPFGYCHLSPRSRQRYQKANCHTIIPSRGVFLISAQDPQMSVDLFCSNGGES